MRKFVHGRAYAVSAVLITIAGAGAFAGWAATSATGAPASVSSQLNAESGQVANVEATFRAAMQTRQSLGNPPATYGRAALSAIRAHSAVPVVSSAVRQELRASGLAALARYFTPAQPKQLAELGLRNALAQDASQNVVNLGAGVSSVKFLRVAVAGLTASVEADVTIWAKSEIRQSSTGPWLMTDPVNVIDYQATLAYSSGRWQVSSLVGNCVQSCP